MVLSGLVRLGKASALSLGKILTSALACHGDRQNASMHSSRSSLVKQTDLLILYMGEMNRR